MKRLILTCILLTFISVGCDSPVSDVNSDTQNTNQPGDIPTSILSEVPPAKLDSVRKTVFNQFKAQHGDQWKISWNEKTGTPLSVFSGTTKAVSRPPVQAARAFLSQNLALFNMPKRLSDLELMEVQTSSRGVRHVRFQQTYKGIPIHNATYQVHIRPDGRIDMANGHYYPDIQASTDPSISERTAIDKAATDLNNQARFKKVPETELMIVRNPETKAFNPAWSVMIAEKGLHWHYIVNATNGEVIERTNMAPSITGDGDIITETSCTTPNPVNRNLFRLYGSGNLEGIFANVHNEESNRAYSSVNSFQYNANSTHFEEVNVYYHIDTYRQNYLNTIGFAGEDIGSDQDLEAYVHDPNYPANYIFSQEAVRFGDPPDYALQDEVIYHEFIHAAADAFNGSHRLDPNDSEEGAIGEGTADYFAGSYTGDAEILNCVSTFPRDMNNPEFTDYSELPRDQQTGEVNAPEHDGGEFFSAILWDLRNDATISVQEADEIIFEAIGRLSGFPNFMEYRNAMMAVDSDVNGGANNNLIQNTFANRGVGNPPPPPPVNVTLSGPSSLLGNQIGTWTADASGGNGTYSYSWEYRERCTNLCTWGPWQNIQESSNELTRSFGNTENESRDVQLSVRVESGVRSSSDYIDIDVVYRSASD